MMQFAWMSIGMFLFACIQVILHALAKRNMPKGLNIDRGVCTCTTPHKAVVHVIHNHFALVCATCSGNCGDCDTIIVPVTKHVGE